MLILQPAVRVFRKSTFINISSLIVKSVNLSRLNALNPSYLELL